jgi:NitT/TauT family transport system substrate-binding protein
MTTISRRSGGLSFGLRAVKRLSPVLAAAALLAGASIAQAADTVTLRLDFLPSGYHAPLFYGVAKGEYSKRDIDLKIADGRGTNAALQAVVSGNDMIVIGNYPTMVQSIGKGMPVIGIGGLIQKLPDSVISLKGSGITKPKDLEGKSLSIPPSSAVFRLFPAFAKAAGIDITKIKQVQMDAAATTTALLQGQVDFTTGWAFTDALRVAKQKPIEPPMLMADYGINILGAGFIVTRDTAKTKGDILKRFMAATAASYAEAVKSPEATLDAMAAARPEIDKALLLEQFKQMPAFFQTARSAGKSFGWTAKEDWEQSVELLTQYFEMTDKVDIANLYTNEFLP